MESVAVSSITQLSWDHLWQHIKDPLTATFQVTPEQLGKHALICITEHTPNNDTHIIQQQSFLITQTHMQLQIRFSPDRKIKPIHLLSHALNTKLKKMAMPHYRFRIIVADQTSAYSPPIYLLVTLRLRVQDNTHHAIQSGASVKLSIVGSPECAVKNSESPNLTTERVALIEQGVAYFSAVPLGTTVAPLRVNTPNGTLEILDENFQHPENEYYLSITSYSAESELQINCLPPPIFINFQEHAGSLCKELFSDDEIAYFKRMDNKAILFIHGYNVAKGEFGLRLKGWELPHSPNMIAALGATEPTLIIPPVIKPILDETCFYTVWRPQQKFMPKEDDTFLLDSWFTTEDEVETSLHEGRNGNGALHWAMAMEYNISRAAGFDEINFKNYRRLAHILWSGEVNYAVNYMNAVQHVQADGFKLATLLQQLLKEKLDVYIIAHSLGCGVALHALQIMAQKQPKAEITHVFLWDAAVPENCLLNKQTIPTTAVMQSYPEALQAVKKATILFSKNDNILGPIPERQAAFISQQEINSTKPWCELIVAMILSYAGLQSVYELAMWIGVSLTELMKPEVQAEVYKAWCLAHQPSVAYCETGFSSEQPHDTTHNLLSLAYSMAQNLHLRPRIIKNIQQQCAFPKTLTEQIALHQQHGINTDYYSHVKNKLLQNADTINAQLSAAGYSITQDAVRLGFWIISKGDQVVSVLDKGSFVWLFLRTPLVAATTALGVDLFFDAFSAYFHVQGLATLVTTMLYDTDYKPTTALGYAGPPLQDPTIQAWIAEKKLVVVDQTDYLFHHSAMKVPTEAVMQKVYQKQVWNVINTIG